MPTKQQTLIDTLSEEDKKKIGITSDDLKYSIGSVHRIKMTEKDGITLIEKEDINRGYRFKRVVIVAEKDGVNYATTLINSEPNVNYISKENIKKDCHPIYRRDYPFIEINKSPSFVDCGILFTFKKERLIQENDHLGYLNASDCDIILNKIKNSDRIDIINLIEFGFIENY